MTDALRRAVEAGRKKQAGGGGGGVGVVGSGGVGGRSGAAGGVGSRGAAKGRNGIVAGKRNEQEDEVVEEELHRAHRALERKAKQYADLVSGQTKTVHSAVMVDFETKLDRVVDVLDNGERGGDAQRRRGAGSVVNLAMFRDLGVEPSAHGGAQIAPPSSWDDGPSSKKSRRETVEVMKWADAAVALDYGAAQATSPPSFEAASSSSSRKSRWGPPANEPS